MRDHLDRAKEYSEAHRLKSDTLIRKIGQRLMDALKIWLY